VAAANSGLSGKLYEIVGDQVIAVDERDLAAFLERWEARRVN
jgi:hypothetical protein